MRVPAVVLVLSFAVAFGISPSESRAEKVKANQTTKVLARPGERGKVLLTVKAGQRMSVIAKEDRWLKVRVAGRTGWVPRSKVDVSTEIARNTRRRSFVDGRGTKRGFNGEEGPSDRIGADAVGEGVEPDDDDEGGRGGRSRRGGGGDEGGDEGGDDDTEIVDDEGGGDDDGDSLVIEEEGEETRETARVKKKTVALQEPEAEAEESFAATPKTVLYPTGNTKGKYTEVENAEGELGYVLTSELEVVESSEGGGGGGRSGRMIDGRARLGVSILSQKLRTAGGAAMLPDNYDINTSAVTLALGGSLMYPYKERFVVGGEASYDYARAIPGIKVPMGTTSVSLHNLRLRAVGGYDLRRKNGMMVYGRLGLHYQSYQVSDVGNLTKNTAKLPSEIITSPAIGVGLGIPRLTKKIGIRAHVDTMLFGSSVKQTKDLEDGDDPSASGAIIGAGMTYKWRKDMDIVAAYDLTIFSMGFGAPLASSQRGHTGTKVTRSDLFHALTVGVSRGF